MSRLDTEPGVHQCSQGQAEQLSVTQQKQPVLWDLGLMLIVNAKWPGSGKCHSAPQSH